MDESMYRDVKARYQRHYKAFERYRAATKMNSISDEDAKKWRVPPAPSNEEVGQMEQYEFEHKNKGEGGTYAGYMSKDMTRITTWMGDTLADVQWKGAEYRGNMGNRAVNFRAKGIDGKLYSGTYYKSSGDYVRMKRIKGGR